MGDPGAGPRLASSDRDRTGALGVAMPGAPATSRPDQPESLSGAAREALTKTRATLDSAVDSGKRTVAEKLSQASESVHRSAEDLRPVSGWLAGMVDRGASELDRVARGLEQRELGDMVGDLTRFGRERPVLFFGSAVLLGFALGRIARMSLDATAERSSYDADEGRLSGRYQGYAGAAHEDEVAAEAPGTAWRPGDATDRGQPAGYPRGGDWQDRTGRPGGAAAPASPGLGMPGGAA
jgi:hypothetical protein